MREAVLENPDQENVIVSMWAQNLDESLWACDGGNFTRHLGFGIVMGVLHFERGWL